MSRIYKNEPSFECFEDPHVRQEPLMQAMVFSKVQKKLEASFIPERKPLDVRYVNPMAPNDEPALDTIVPVKVIRQENGELILAATRYYDEKNENPLLINFKDIRQLRAIQNIPPLLQQLIDTFIHYQPEINANSWYANT